MEQRGPEAMKRRKKRQEKRKNDSFRKNQPHFVTSTPSSSAPPLPIIDPSLASMNREKLLSFRQLGKEGGVIPEIDLSNLGSRKIVRFDDSIAKKCKCIGYLNLSRNAFSNLPDVFQLNTVRSINLQSNGLSALNITHPMTGVVELNISGNQLTEFPSAATLRHMPNIQKLFLNNNLIREIPEKSIEVLSKTFLSVLHLANNKLESLPVQIGLLTSLKSLNLNDNSIAELPNTIYLLSELLKSSTNFTIKRNKLIYPPQEIADRAGMISIMKHLQASGARADPGHRGSRESDQQRSSCLRLVVVGNEGAGKSTMIKMLSEAELTAESILDTSELTFSSKQSEQAPENPLFIRLEPGVRLALRELLGEAPEPDLLPDHPIILNVCDFRGQEECHAAAEMFFSVTSLQVVVFDLSITKTRHDCDVRVQYWIDLIQARAPGSTIVVVATHIDSADMTPELVEERLLMVEARLTNNEALRVADLTTEVEHCAASDPDHANALRALLRQRPNRYRPILRFASSDERCMTLKHLLAHLSHIASPTAAAPNPLRIINTPVPMRYMSVLNIIRGRRKRGIHFCTIQDLDIAVNARFDSYLMRDEEQSQIHESTLEVTKNAVVYWASVGEVVWFAPKESNGMSRADSALFSNDNSTSDGIAGAAAERSQTEPEAAAVSAEDSTTDLLLLAAENALRNRADSETAVAESAEDNCWSIGGAILTDRVKGEDDIDLDAAVEEQYVLDDEASDRSGSDGGAEEASASESDSGGSEEEEWSDEAEEGGYGSGDGYGDSAEQSGADEEHSRHSEQSVQADHDNATPATVDPTTSVETKCDEECAEASGIDDAGRIILSSFVFLNPTWLNKAFMGVINRQAMAKIESDRSYCASRADSESMHSNFLNGIVTWGLVRRFLLKNPAFRDGKQEFASEDENIPERERRELTLALLKEVLTRLTLIIPIESSNAGPGAETTKEGATAAAGSLPSAVAPHSPVNSPPAANPSEPSDAASVSTAHTSDDRSYASWSHHHSSGHGHRRGHRRGGSVSSVSAGSEALAEEADLDPEELAACYLLPALLAEQNAVPRTPYSPHPQMPSDPQTSGSNVSFAQKGWIRLERRFTFSRFVPSAIVPRIIAKMYSRFGQVLKTSAAEMSGAGIERTTCWNSAFIQEYGDCRVWILFEEDLAGNVPALKAPPTKPHITCSSAPATFASPRSRLASRDFAYAVSEQQDKARKVEEEYGIALELDRASRSSSDLGLDTIAESSRSFTFDFFDGEDGDPFGGSPYPAAGESDNLSAVTAEDDEERANQRVVQLRIISFGHLLHVNAAVDALDDYHSAVQEILNEYRGVSQVFPTTLCPVCLLRQLPAEQCGQFLHTEREAVARSLEELCAYHRASSKDVLVRGYRRWERKWMEKLDCPDHQCMVKPEFLVRVPRRLREAITPEQQLESLTSYIRNDIVNRALGYGSNQCMVPADEDVMSSALVRVMAIYRPDQLKKLEDWYSGLLPVGETLPEFTVRPGKVVTGTAVSLMEGPPQEARVASTAVLTSFMLSEPGHRLTGLCYFLVGGNKQWLYLARFIHQPVTQEQKDYSDAALLELVAPISPLPMDCFSSGSVQFQIRPNYMLKRGEDRKRLDPFALGQEFRPLPLYLPRMHRASWSLLKDGRHATVSHDHTRSLGVELQVEQALQIWGLDPDSRDGVEHNWVRVVHRNQQIYLVNGYAEQRLSGGAVLDCAGRVVGVVSRRPYRGGLHLAFYVASLDDLEWC